MFLQILTRRKTIYQELRIRSRIKESSPPPAFVLTRPRSSGSGPLKLQDIYTTQNCSERNEKNNNYSGIQCCLIDLELVRAG